MFHSCVLYGALMVQGFVILLVKSESTYHCNNTSLVDLNETVSVSTLTGNGIEHTYNGATAWYFCWNITTHDWWQIQAKCQYQQTVSLYRFELHLSRRPTLPPWNYIWSYPAEFYSSGHLVIFTRIFNPGTLVACEIRPVRDKNEQLLCGPKNINLTDQYLLSVSIPGNRVGLECLWLVTSPPETTTFVDVLNPELVKNQRLVFGQGHNSANKSTVLGEIDHTNASLENGSSFFSTGTYLWISFTSSVYKDENNPPIQRLFLRVENYTGEVRCKLGQSLCSGYQSRCIPLRALCDGTVQCSNYMDETGSCDRCGISEIAVQFGEPVTIRGEFDDTPDSRVTTGYFAIHRGDSESLPNSTSSSDVIVSNYTEGVSMLECVWRLTEAEGTRIRVTVTEFSGSSFVMRIGNGRDPTATPAKVIMAHNGIHSPVAIPSIESGVWVTLESVYHHGNNLKLRLVFTTYNVTECEEGQFQCLSGLDCLDNFSRVCDGRRECAAYGDELDCGVCGQLEFKCGTTDSCVPRHQICDRKANCEDYSDELMCGFCGNETVHLSPSETYLIRQNDNAMCLWVIFAELGWQMKANIRWLSPECVVTIGVGYNTTNPVSQEVLREVDVKSYLAYPRSITTSSSIMWIKSNCHRYLPSSEDMLQISLSQYRIVDCSSGEHLCESGLQCFQEEARCNGTPECPEFWDEISCGNCSKNEFTCRVGHNCISRDRVCDGRNDCPDLSDELDCGPCEGSFYNLSGGEFKMLTSPGWPLRNYPPHTQCLWLLMAETGYQIVLYFEEFHLEESFDFLYCGDGDEFNNVFLKLSGAVFPRMVASTENKMFVRFTSDFMVQTKGFELQVQQKLSETVSCGEGEITCQGENLICVRNDSSKQGLQICSRGKCGRSVISLSDESKDLHSPGYPGLYPPDVVCQWEVVSKDGVLVSILKFSTETLSDILRFDGSTRNGGNISFVLHGTTKVTSIALNSPMRISFTTDSAVEDTGFHLRLCKSLHEDDYTSCLNSLHIDCGDGSWVSPDARCDGFRDCQTYGSDEHQCQNITCPGSYHCLNSSNCVHSPLVCDGKPDCTQGDDETDNKCGQRCPAGCQCDVDEGSIEVECKHGWNTSTLANLVKRTTELEISEGNASFLVRGVFKGFTYLTSLRLQNNNIDSIKPGTFYGLANLTSLDISNNSITSIDANTFLELQNLEVLIAMEISLETIEEKAFNGLKKLRSLVLIRRRSPSHSTVVVKDGALADLMRLEKLYVDDHRLCCEFKSSIGFDVSNCFSTERQPPLNLCGSLMRNNFLRVSMWILGLSALVGNAAVIIRRCCQGKEKGGKRTHSFLVLNLAVSDFMMGVYMLIIAGADLYFGEKYSREAKEWRSSPICKTAGVISVLSSEASVFFVTLISLNSFYSIVFPFGRIRLGEKSTASTVTSLWLASLSLSVVPTVLVSSDSEVYGLSDVCIGLPLLTKPTGYDLEENKIDIRAGIDPIMVPVGRGKEPAWIYSIILFLGVNLLCFLVVLFCYITIFVNVKRTSSRVKRMTHRDQEIKTAVKMALIVGTDFACWMPVIIMGILSQTGVVDISLDMYAWTVVFILPINSSLNPYMYTFYTALATRRHNQGALKKTTRPSTEMKTKSFETIHSTVSGTLSS